MFIGFVHILTPLKKKILVLKIQSFPFRETSEGRVLAISARYHGNMTSADFLFPLENKISHSKVILVLSMDTARFTHQVLRKKFWTSSFIAELSA